MHIGIASCKMSRMKRNAPEFPMSIQASLCHWRRENDLIVPTSEKDVDVLIAIISRLQAAENEPYGVRNIADYKLGPNISGNIDSGLIFSSYQAAVTALPKLEDLVNGE